MKKTLFLIVMFTATVVAFSQSASDYRQRIKTIRQNIDHYFFDNKSGYYKEFNFRDSNDKKYSYLWPLCGLVQAANESDAAGLTKDYMRTVVRQLQPYYDVAPPAPGYNSYILAEEKEERFYDDNQWIGLACMDAYSRTKQTAYLQIGKEIYRFMMSGFDTASGGGLYWKEKDLTTKNTCSNGPGVLLALQLYKATNDRTYLDTALLIYNWVNQKLLAPEGVYYDHVRLPSGKIDKRFYTYNAGTMLQSAVVLYELLGEQSYLRSANEIAAASNRVFFKNGRWPSNYWFNAVLLRGYVDLYKHTKDRQYIDAFVADGNRIWQSEMDEKKLIGPHKKKSLLDQAAMLEIYARLLMLQ